MRGDVNEMVAGQTFFVKEMGRHTEAAVSHLLILATQNSQFEGIWNLFCEW
jgi:hypothetical protein